MRDLITKLEQGTSLSETEMATAMKGIMSGQVAEPEIVSFLTSLRDKGETEAELLGAARVMREFCVKVSVNPENLVDTCGTGGDQMGTINISTTAALVVAGAGVRVAKHGNRAVSSQTGSADVLEKLGVKIDLEPVAVRRCLAEAGIGFFFAPRYHPAMRNVMPARKKIGTRTIFNLLGPLTNPAAPVCQVIGVFDSKKMVMMARVLKTLGSRHLLLVHGSDGLDEITLTGPSLVVELSEGEIREYFLDPRPLGFDYARPEDLQGGEASRNCMVVRGILEGYVGKVRDVVVLNAAAALKAADRARDLEEGIVMAERSLDHGEALRALKKLIEVSNA